MASYHGRCQGYFTVGDADFIQLGLAAPSGVADVGKAVGGGNVGELEDASEAPEGDARPKVRLPDCGAVPGEPATAGLHCGSANHSAPVKIRSPGFPRDLCLLIGGAATTVACSGCTCDVS